MEDILGVFERVFGEELLCSQADGDAYRFGKSVIRKTGSDGKLIDSNNSTNDFESNTKASLIK